LKRKINQREKKNSKDSSDVYTKDPLTKKGEKILAAMKKLMEKKRASKSSMLLKTRGRSVEWIRKPKTKKLKSSLERTLLIPALPNRRWKAMMSFTRNIH